jgi:hypothetical protein
MEIGPIPGIRPVTMIKPSRAAEDLTAVFAIEFGREQNDNNSSSHQKASRGLEDEDDTVTLGVDENDRVHSFERAGDGAVNFFA